MSISNTEKQVKEIRSNTRRKFSSEEKIVRHPARSTIWWLQAVRIQSWPPVLMRIYNKQYNGFI